MGSAQVPFRQRMMKCPSVTRHGTEAPPCFDRQPAI